MSRDESEADVAEFLEDAGRGECTVRVLQAMPSLSDDHTTWTMELQAMGLDGDLAAFLDACAPPAQLELEEQSIEDLEAELLEVISPAKAAPERGSRAAAAPSSADRRAAAALSAADAPARVTEDDVAVLLSFYEEFQPEFAQEAKCREVLGYYLRKSAIPFAENWRDALKAEYKKQKGVDPWEHRARGGNAPAAQAPAQLSKPKLVEPLGVASSGGRTGHRDRSLSPRSPKSPSSSLRQPTVSVLSGSPHAETGAAVDSFASAAQDLGTIAEEMFQAS